mgnify:FL=1
MIDAIGPHGPTRTNALIVVPILTAHGGSTNAQRRREEAAGLAKAIDLDVRRIDETRLTRVRPSTLFGTGKTDKIKLTVAAEAVEVAIVDHPLTPVQQRNLELAWHCKVLDRTALILEIFGARAQTYEGRLQVELAALKYQRSRLVRSWTHLERQRGGYGFIGGPGESQLEIDRRLTDKRITKLHGEIENIRKTRSLQRSSRQRSALPTVALVGYTNAGKSTLFNRLTESSVVAKDMLFATLDPTMRRMVLPSGQEVVLCDTVGFISNLPTELVASFRATLEEIVEADLVLHIQDATSGEALEQRHTVEAIVQSIADDRQIQMIDVFNKIDLVADDWCGYQSEHSRNGAICVSAVTGDGIDALSNALDSKFGALRQVVIYDIPSTDGSALAWLYKNGDVISTEPQDMSSIVKVALQVPDVGRFARRFSLEPLQ